MATHFSFLVWRITWTEEPGGLQAMGSKRPHDNTSVNICLSMCYLSLIVYAEISSSDLCLIFSVFIFLHHQKSVIPT